MSIKTVTDLTLCQVKALDSFTRYCVEMRDKGAAHDVASASSALQRRAAELLEFDADKLSEAWNQSHDVRFTPIHWLYTGSVSLLGSISIGDDTLGLCLL